MTRRWPMAAGGGIALAVVVVLGVVGVRALEGAGGPPRVAASTWIATRAQVNATVDRFGISYMRPTEPGGTFWESDWSTSRRMDNAVDPRDPWFDSAHGNGWEHADNGVLYVSGTNPRMYVHDPAMKRQWTNVEATIYFKRISDDAVPYTGMTIVARANHLVTEDGTKDLCDTRGYGGRLRFDGYVDFEKETAHPRNVARDGRQLWPSGMPKDVWIGMKYLVWDQSDGVHLQIWRDMTNGADGGDWQLVDDTIDRGDSWGTVPCAPGINPRMILSAAPQRRGSESGEPNASVYFRSDGIHPDGLEYKWASIREINVH